MSIAPIENFIKKYQTARSYNSKEIRLTIAEAEEISTAMSLVLAKIGTMGDRIIELQDRILAEKTEVDMSGGSFT